MLTFERLAFDPADWGPRLETFEDRTVCQSPEWMQFVAETQHAEPVLAALRQKDQTVGFFTGLIVRRFGMRILGSPLPGWTTTYMGFNLAEGVSRRAAVEALIPFAFDGLRCVHVELMDLRLKPDDLDGLGLQHTPCHGYHVDLSQSEERLLANMAPKSCRYSLRKATRSGVTVEEAADPQFADEYYDQLKEVFAKRQLVPTYGIERVRALIRHVHPTGHLLLLRARDPKGRCIATALFPSLGRMMYFWGAASWRRYQHLCPNEALVWHAMRYWKQRGVTTFDMGGAGAYKRKYGGANIVVPWWRKSKYASLTMAREAVRSAFRLQQRVRGLFKKAGPPHADDEDDQD